MIAWLKKEFALSERGAKDLVIACLACTIYNIMLMVPMGLVYIFLKQLFMHLDKEIAAGTFTAFTTSAVPYIIGTLIIILISLIAAGWQYDSCFLSAYKETKNTRIALAEKLRKLPLSFFGNRDLADLTTTMLSDVTGLETAFSHYIPELAGAVLALFICSVGLMFIDPVMSLSIIWIIPASFIVVFLGKGTLDRANDKNNKNKVERADSLQEFIENIKEIKSNNQSEKYIGRIKALLKKQTKDTIMGELTNAVVVNLAGFLVKLAYATVVICGAGRLVSGKTDALTFVVFMLGAIRILAPVDASLINIAAIFASIKQIDRMKAIYGESEQGGEAASSDAEGKYNGYDIVFENVKFAYNSGEQVINDVSFTAKQGEVTALIGPSGGGKSTCTKLSARFWDIQGGRITVGGRDISRINPEELLKSYSIVFQDVLLFNATIMENIRLGKQGALDEEVIKAAKDANCMEFIERLPEGFNTLIGENGSQLSGGERQRISIARAILKNAPIVLLDEATASLDVENESKVQKALSALLKDKTVLVIAHRMRTIANADKIIVLSEGKVAEEGSPAELLSKNGIYSRMKRLQEESAEWNI